MMAVRGLKRPAEFVPSVKSSRRGVRSGVRSGATSASCNPVTSLSFGHP
jgi:hypothetical protein